MAPDPDSHHGAVQGDVCALLKPIARRLGLRCTHAVDWPPPDG